MIENEMDRLRDKLNLMIFENKEYSKILKVSQDLDELIVQYIQSRNNVIHIITF
jgi:hypothetical protein